MIKPTALLMSRPPKKGIVALLFALLTLGPVNLLISQSCCDESICKNEAIGYVNRFISITSSPLFADPPSVKKKELKDQLDQIKKQDRNVYSRFTNEIEAFSHWMDLDKVDTADRAYCFYSNFPEANEMNQNWVMESTSILNKHNFRSPEFCRGFGFQIEAGTGVKDLATDSESFIGSLTGFVSYTFAPKDKNQAVDSLYFPEACNGRFRIMLGLSESYVDQLGLTQGVIRGEVRLFDIKTEFFSIGNVKGIAQANMGINRSYHSAGLGIGAEFEIIGFNIMYGIGIEKINSIIQTSLVYLF